MRKYFCLLLIGSIVFFACRTKDIRDYTIIIKPLGPEDVPRTTFYIALKKTNFSKKDPFPDEILTDENSLRCVASFIEDYRPAKSDTIDKESWGALEISTYNTNHLIVDYKINNKEQSRNYLTLLIQSLERNNSDAKLIKLLKQGGLSEIDY